MAFNAAIFVGMGEAARQKQDRDRVQRTSILNNLSNVYTLLAKDPSWSTPAQQQVLLRAQNDILTADPGDRKSSSKIITKWSNLFKVGALPDTPSQNLLGGEVGADPTTLAGPRFERGGGAQPQSEEQRTAYLAALERKQREVRPTPIGDPWPARPMSPEETFKEKQRVAEENARLAEIGRVPQEYTLGPGDVRFSDGDVIAQIPPVEPAIPTDMANYEYWKKLPEQQVPGVDTSWDAYMASRRAEPAQSEMSRFVELFKLRESGNSTPDQDAELRAMEARLTMASRAGYDLRNPGEFSQAQINRASSEASRFDSNRVVTNFLDQLTRVEGLREILDQEWSGPQDMATVFGFMRVLDPTSVVRESEYARAATVGNIFKGWAARFNGMLSESGGFLSEQVKEDFLITLEAQMEVAAEVVRNLYQDVGRRIERQLYGSDEAVPEDRRGSGVLWLTDPTKLLPAAFGYDTVTEAELALMAQESNIAIEVLRQQAIDAGLAVVP